MTEPRNYGILEGQRPTDYMVGSSPIVYEERLPSGDWTPFLPPGEKQASIDFVDSMACVSFSATNCIETQIKFLTGEQPNFSDRFLAKMSGTTPQGNYLYLVGDTIRKVGLVDEAEWPTPPKFTWASYYADIPQIVIDKGAKFLEKYDVKYEFLVDTSYQGLLKQLKHSPLQVVIPGHAVEGYATIGSPIQLTRYFDSYSPYNKEWKQNFGSVLKYVVTLKTPTVITDRLVTAGKDVYQVKNGRKNQFINAQTFQLIDGRWDKIEKITQAELDKIPDGHVLVAVPNE